MKLQTELALSTVVTDPISEIISGILSCGRINQLQRDPPLKIQSESSLATLFQNLAPDPLYPPPKAATYIGVTEGTLSVWRCNKRYEIPYIKVGRLVRYRKSALDAWLLSRTHANNVINKEQF